MRDGYEFEITDVDGDTFAANTVEGYLFFRTKGRLAGPAAVVGINVDQLKRLRKFLKKWLKENDEG
jgi:hypothetical protein